MGIREKPSSSTITCGRVLVGAPRLALNKCTKPESPRSTKAWSAAIFFRCGRLGMCTDLAPADFRNGFVGWAWARAFEGPGPTVLRGRLFTVSLLK